MILNKLNNHLSQKVTIVIQSVLFSLFHFNLAQLIPTFLLGLFLGFCYFKFIFFKKSQFCINYYFAYRREVFI